VRPGAITDDDSSAEVRLDRPSPGNGLAFAEGLTDATGPAAANIEGLPYEPDPASATDQEEHAELIVSDEGEAGDSAKEARPVLLVTREQGTWIVRQVGPQLTWYSVRAEAEDQPEALAEIVRRVFAAARHEEFEDGMESRFSHHLENLVRRYGKQAVDTLIDLIGTRFPNDEVAAEALTCLSRMRDSGTRAWRYHALTLGLKSPSVFVRDAATVGLARLGDRAGVTFLKKALERERSPMLREYMEDVVRQLGGG